jgi:hypothetical protein
LVKGKIGAATTKPARTQARSMGAYGAGVMLNPWAKTISGNGPADLAGAAASRSFREGLPTAG